MNKSNQRNNGTPAFHEESGAVVFEAPKPQEEVARQRRVDEQHEFARRQVTTNIWMVVFTGALVLATACTIGVGIWQASLSKESADAAKVSADAAKSAAQTASDTLNELKDNEASSTSQFKEQLGRLDASIKQAQRMANATEQANANAIAADRPWIAGRIEVTDFDVDKKGHVTCTLENTGKRPARILFSTCTSAL